MRNSVCFVITLLIACVFTSCEQERFGLIEDQHPTIPGYDYERDLTHKWDTTLTYRAIDEMTSRLAVYTTEDGKRMQTIYDNTNYPLFTAEIMLEHKEYNITEDLLNPEVTFEYLYRGQGENSLDEVDSLIVTLADAQKISVPIIITNYAAITYGNYSFSFGSLKVKSAEYVGLTNTLIQPNTTRAAATYVSANYNTEYTVLLTLEEVNVDEPQTFEVPLRISAIRHLLSENDEDVVVAENKERIPIDSLTERCSFERVATYKSGEQVRRGVQIIINHLFKGIDPYEKEVDNFDHALTSSNNVVEGTATKVEREVEKYWTVEGRTDKYGANVENGIEKDKIVTDYTLYHEKAVYDDGKVKVEFDFEPVQVNELNTKVSPVASEKSGFVKADEVNSIGTTYLGYQQNLSETVHLFREIKVEDNKLMNGKITVYTDSVVVDIDYVDILTDGSEVKHPDHLKVDWSVICTTNWKSTQVAATQETSDPVVGDPTSADRKNGYWSYKLLTRKITSEATLHDNSTKQNAWTSVVPNSFVYTRDGLTYKFDEIAYDVTHVGATLNLKSGSTNIYDYSDVIKVTFGDKNKNSAAPGELTCNGDDVAKREFRDKDLTATLDAVVAKATYVVIHKNGKEDKTPYSKTLPGSRKVNSNWSANESNESQTTGKSNVQLSSEKKTDDVWSWNEQTRQITSSVKLNSSTQTNSYTVVVPNNIVLTVDGQKCDFGTIDFKLEDVSSTVNLNSKQGLTSVYDYSNVIAVTYGSDTKNMTAPGKITVTLEKKEIDWKITNPQISVTPLQVIASLTFTTYYNDNTQKEEKENLTVNGDFKTLTNWSATATNANQTTGAAEVNTTNATPKTEGYWRFNQETRRIDTKATLTGSTQTNSYQSVVANNVVYSRNGKTHDFGTINFQVVENNANVVKSSESELSAVYAYTDNITVTYGTSINGQAPGTITVEKPWNPDFPDEWGKFVDCKFTCARNEAHDTWVYIASIHFEKGTLPVIFRRDSNNPEVNHGYFEYNTDSRLNSGNYVRSYGKWINTIASDEGDYMLWATTDNKNVDSFPYDTATAWNWDYGYTSKGLPTVFTNRFSAAITANGSVLTIKKEGNVVASWKAKR